MHPALPGRAESSSATGAMTSILRDEMYTLTPASTKPREIIWPIPWPPPVTSAVLPRTLNSSVIAVPLIPVRRGAGVLAPLPGPPVWAGRLRNGTRVGQRAARPPM